MSNEQENKNPEKITFIAIFNFFHWQIFYRIWSLALIVLFLGRADWRILTTTDATSTEFFIELSYFGFGFVIYSLTEIVRSVNRIEKNTKKIPTRQTAASNHPTPDLITTNV